MEGKKGKIAVFDLDHTLLDNSRNEISPSSLLALSKLRKHCYIAVASGRDMDNYYSYMYRDIIKPDAVIHQNGTRVAVRKDDRPYDPERGAEQYELIFNHFMDPELVKRILKYAMEHHLCVGTTVNGRDYFVNPKLKEEADQSYNKFLKRRFAPPEEGALLFKGQGPGAALRALRRRPEEYLGLRGLGERHRTAPGRGNRSGSGQCHGGNEAGGGLRDGGHLARRDL